LLRAHHVIVGKLKVLPEQPEPAELEEDENTAYDNRGPRRADRGASTSTPGDSDEGDVDEDSSAEPEEVEVCNVTIWFGFANAYGALFKGVQPNLFNTGGNSAAGCTEAHQEESEVTTKGYRICHSKVCIDVYLLYYVCFF